MNAPGTKADSHDAKLTIATLGGSQTVTLTVIVKISGPKHSTVALTGRAVMTETDPTPGDNVQVIGVSLP